MTRSMIPGIRRTAERGSAVVEALRADHAQLAALFDRFAAVAGDENLLALRDRLANCICDTLSRQRIAEEELLYPEIRREDDKLVFALLLADQGISMRIAEIRDPAASRLDRDLAVLRLIAMVRRCMAEREQALFPFLLARLPAARMQWLNAALAQRKRPGAAADARPAVAPAPLLGRPLSTGGLQSA